MKKNSPIEIIGLRGEKSKTYDMGDRHHLVIGGNIRHWKEDYSNDAEEWKECDLSWDGNRIDKAPYILEANGKKFTVTDRKTNVVSTIELLSSNSREQCQVVPYNVGVAFQYVLSSLSVPFEAQFRVQDITQVVSRAWDDIGDIELDVTFKDGILTEKLSEARDRVTGQVRDTKGIIRVDPIFIVGASADDCVVVWDGSAWVINLVDEDIGIGYMNATHQKMGSGMRFPDVTIFKESTITSAFLRFVGIFGSNIAYSRITGEATDDAAVWSTIADYQTRRGTVVGGANNNNITTARVTWDWIDAFVAGTTYDSPSIVTIIQEIVDRAGWASGNALALWWDDHEFRGYSRWVAAWDNSHYDPPELHVEYIPPAPKNVTATNGSYTNKVRINWWQCGATHYQVYRDGTPLGWVTARSYYDDLGADAPSITPGAASASDGTSEAHVVLNLAGQSADNGTIHTYKVRAKNATGESPDSFTATGYRGVGALVYQWQRSAADSDANYSSIAGGTTDPYNDTEAPKSGSGRYYRCVLTASGAASKTSTADRGYKIENTKYELSATIGDVIDCGALVDSYERMEWIENIPSIDQDITISIRSSDDSVIWTGWENILATPCTNFATPVRRYLEWRAVLTTTDTYTYATLSELEVHWKSEV